MDADERLTALKKAYADIILNTAKEAAARIMVSERKALRFEQELNVTKERALQMLLRVKQVMDSKVNEAEMTYLNRQTQHIKIEELEGQLRDAKNIIREAEVTSLRQQSKIEELEAQLHEAEDIVKDLREEKREVQAELERVRNSKLQYAARPDAATWEQTAKEKRFHTSQSIIFPPVPSQHESFTTSEMRNSASNHRTGVYKCYNLPFRSEGNRLNTSDSIIFPPPESQSEAFRDSEMKSSSFKQSNEVYRSRSANDSCTGNSYVSKPDLPSIILRSKEAGLYRNRRTQRIRAFEEKLMAGELSFSEPIDDVNNETGGRDDGEGEGICKTPTHKGDTMCSKGKKDIVQADSSWLHVQKVKSFHQKRRRATRYKNNKTTLSRYQVLKRDQRPDISCMEENSVNDNAQSGKYPSNTALKLLADITDNSTLLGCTSVTQSDAEFAEAGNVQNTTENDSSIDKLLPTRSESRSADSSEVPICIMDVEKVDLPVVNSEAKASGTSSGFLNQPVTDRVIKYTFQRKRKRESMNNSGANASLEKGILTKKTAEKHSGPQEMENSGLITESSRDSRRLAQVARQLISLSEKKWWQ